MKEILSDKQTHERQTSLQAVDAPNLRHGAHLWQICKTNRYLITSLLLLVVMSLQFLYGKWTADFWEHSAVVRELATHPHPLNAQHPLLLVDVPHPFFSPYLLFVGLFARLFSLNAIMALTVAGIGNLLFLLFGLRLFIQRFFDERQEAIAFYALLFILFMWSSRAWNWSGFLHFKVLGYVLPYPSTFAMAATFVAFAVYFRALSNMSVVRVMLAVLLGAVVLITHPTTAVILFVGIAAISMHFWQRRGMKAPVVGGVVVIGIVLLAFLWPYYSFFDLLRVNTPDFHTDSYDLYGRFYLIWPTLLLLPLALPLLLSRFKRNRFDVLVLMLVTAVLIFIGGYISGQYGFGRIISFIAIIIQISAAAMLAKLEVEQSRHRFLRYAPVAFIGLLVLVSINSPNVSALGRAMKGVRGVRYDYSDYLTLGRFVDQYDVILSDIESSWMIPTFGGKVVASKHPAHWVDDHQLRRQDLGRFFADDADKSERLEIIGAYEADFLLIDHSQVSDPEIFYEFGDKLFDNEAFLLIRVGDG